MKTTMKTTNKKAKPPIKSIREERAACIAAFKKYPDSIHAWCCHHQRLSEVLDKTTYGGDLLNTALERAMPRINFIRTGKPKHEKAIRYRNFRPVKPIRAGQAHTHRIFNRQWPGNTWSDTEGTIF